MIRHQEVKRSAQPLLTKIKPITLPRIAKIPEKTSTGKKLNHKSPFSEVMQYLAEKYLLTPYKNAPTSGKIKRQLHGATHAASAAFLADNAKVNYAAKTFLPHVNQRTRTYHGGLFIELLKKHLPNQYFSIINKLNGGRDLTEEDFTLTKYAVFCHDIANTQESFKDEAAHAKIFAREMVALGFNPNNVEKFARAIAKKDAPEPKNIFQMIIHDADCLEINRIFSHHSAFDIEELDIVKLFRKLRCSETILTNFLSDIRQIAEFYFATMQYIYSNDKVHEKCEFGANCYQQTSNIIQAVRVAAQLPALFTMLNPSHVTTPTSLDPLTLYITSIEIEDYFDLVKNYLGSYELDEKQDKALEQYQTNGVFIRKKHNFEIEDETLTKNAETLAAKNIKKSAELRQYFSSDEKTNEAKLLNGFYFRPSTFIKKGLPIKEINENIAGLIIDSTAASVLATHFYKDNVSSDSISKSFLFKRPRGTKSITDQTLFQQKLKELEQRRCGQAWDNYNRHFGTAALFHNEILLTYEPKNIIGIIVPQGKDGALQALQHRNFLYQKYQHAVKFYRYLPESDGLHRLSDIAVLFQYETGSSFFHEYSDDHLKIQLLKKEIIPNIPDKLRITLNTANFTRLESSLAHHHPSPEHPIVYRFSDAKQNLEGQCFYKNGLPIIEINSKQYYDNLDMIVRIAHEHQLRLIQKCNDKLRETNNYFLRNFGINNLRLSIQDNPGRSKDILVLQFEPVTFLKPIKVDAILNAIGYLTDKLKWNVLSRTSPFLVRLAVLQAVDVIHNFLTKPHAQEHKEYAQMRQNVRRF